MLEIVERLSNAVSVPLAAQPNAGLPREVEGRTLYLSSPEFVAAYARRFAAAGVRLVGGCCGTTPDHIRHIKGAVASLNGGRWADLARTIPCGTAIDTL